MVWAVVMDELLCEIRWAEDVTNQSPGMLTGTLLTYGERARDRAERWAEGSAIWPADGFVVNEQHNRQAPIVRVIPYVEDGKVKVSTPLPNTQRGRDAATNIREGVLTGLSVEFRGPQARMVGGVREIRQAHLEAAGLVDLASYTGSTVEVRESTGGVTLPRLATLWL